MSTVRGPAVISLWGAGNAALLGMLIGYGERPFAIALYGGSVLLVEVVGAVFWLGYLSGLPRGATAPAPRSSRPAMLVGVVAAFVGLGFVYRPWLAAPAALPALALVTEWLSHAWDRHEAVMPWTRANQGAPSAEDSRLPMALTAATLVAAVLAVRRFLGRRPS